MMNRLLLTILRFCLYTIISVLAMLPTTASAEKMTFPKIDRKPRPDRERLRQLEGLPQYDPESGYEANLNLRLHDLSQLDLSGSLDGLLHTEFDDRTVWPGSDKMPSGFDPQEIMELGKNPGLGIRSLHQRGITGRGVRIAILDQPLLVGHQEYADRLQLYEEIHIPHGMGPQWHGPMVASMAVGKTVGAAPEAELFYIGQLNYDWENGRTSTLRYLVQGIYRLLEINKQLPPNNKIRAISISRGWTRSDKDYELVAEAVQKAQAEGILMVFTSVELFNGGYDINKLGREPLANPDDFDSFGPAVSDTHGFWEDDFSPADNSHPKEIYVPTDSRTTASAQGTDEYVFDRNGGSSKYPPFIAGVYALAVQVDPSITPERFWALAAKTGRTIEIELNGRRRPLGPILDPVRLIRSIEMGEAITMSEKQRDSHPLQTNPQNDSEKKSIVPGVSVGDFTLGMSKDEVLRRLGKPQFIYHGNERYTLDNLPREYRLYYGDIEFEVENNAVQKIMTHSPSYTLPNDLTVGDSADKVTQAFGTDFDGDRNSFTYESKGLRFEFNDEKRTVNEIRIFQAQPENDVDKSDSRGDFKSDVFEGDNLEAYDDVEDMDLSACDLRSAGDIMNTLSFNQKTLWPPAERLPDGFDPQILLQEGMNPGLGVRALHARGITGAGVHVGLIDQPLLVDHPEYAGKIVSYYHPGFESSESSMHAPAMASLLVGEQCGTAPDAKLHVVAVPSWNHDAGDYARALDRFVEYNQKAPQEDKIRVVSVSCQPSGEESVFNNQSQWDEAVERAQTQGILVLDGTWHHGFVSLCWLDPQNRESVESCTPGFREGPVEVDEGHIHVPAKPRTWAEAYEGQPFGYNYRGGGSRGSRPKAKNGYSPTMPYAAGILALGWQINPDLTPAQIKDLLFASAYVHESGAKIINPTAFIELVREQNEN